ncbi:MAG: hypothetical protein J6N49_04170 [Alphaproteobacteria bacterium]|nr:hypothetical protein [Alphaproteobacteria bacterium]
MNSADVKKYVEELVALYKAGADRDSARSKELFTLLSDALPKDVENAANSYARFNLRNPELKSFIDSIPNEVEAIRQAKKGKEETPQEKNTDKHVQPKPQPEKESARQEKSENKQTKNESSQPAPQPEKKPAQRKNKNSNQSALGKGQQAVLATLAEYASEEGIDLTTVTRDNYRDIVSRLETAQEKAIAADLHVYLTDKTDDYSDRIADYLSADDLSPSKQRYHWTKTLSILRSEFTARPQSAEERVNRDKVMELALNVYQSSKIRSDKNPKVPEPRVTELTEALLTKMSKVAQSDYQKRLQKNKHRIFPRDKFLADIKSNTRNDQDLIPLTDKIAAAHVQKMLESLEPAAQDKYIASLRKNDLAEYIPKGYVPHKKEHETKQNNGDNPHKEGDKTMAEENKNAEDTAQPAEQPTEENTFKPSAIQQKACELAGLNWEDYKDAASLMTAVEDKGFKIDGANILKMDGENSSVVATVNEDEQNNNPQPKTEEKKEEEKEEEKKEETKEPITFTPLEENNTPVQTQENDDWIARKAAYYKGLSDENKIENYERDETVQNGFAASFNGAKIHYSTPNDVAVSKEAGLDVFDAMLKEPDNKGRRVNFSPDMTPEMAARLYAACLINGNEMGGNAPQLTEEQLKAALGDEEYAVFQQKMAERAQQQETQQTAEQPTAEQPTTEQPNREGAETTNTEATSAESTEVKEPTKEEIKQALRDQYDMAQMEMAGKVSKAKEPRLPDTPPYVKGSNCSDEEYNKYIAMQERAKDSKEMLLEQYKKDPEAFRATMNEVIQEAQISKISALKTRVHLNQTREETPEDKKARMQENIKATQAALGIIPEYTDKNGVKHQKLEGDALDAFVTEKKISAYTYGNLGGKDATFAEKLPPVKKDGDAKRDFANGQTAYTARTTNSNTGRS